MLSGRKRRPLTTEDLMHRQEVGPPKRPKLARGQDEDNPRHSNSSASGEDPQSEESSGLDEDEDGQDSAYEIPIQNEEEDVRPSRFSLKPRQGLATGETAGPSHVPSPPSTFPEMGVSSSLISAMNKMSIHKPTEIQAVCIPPLLNGMYFSFPVLHHER